MFSAILAIRGLLKGAKTFLVGTMMVVVALMEGPLGMDIPMVEISGNWFELFSQGMAAMTIRAGIASVTKNILGV